MQCRGIHLARSLSGTHIQRVTHSHVASFLPSVSCSRGTIRRRSFATVRPTPSGVCDTFSLHSPPWCRTSIRVHVCPIRITLPLFAIVNVLLLLQFVHDKRRIRSFARVHFCPFTAFLARHVTAPVKLTVALPRLGVLVRVVTSAATKQLTAVKSPARTVTPAAVCAHWPRRRVTLTVVRRLLEKHQITTPRFLVWPLRSPQLQSKVKQVSQWLRHLHADTWPSYYQP